MTQSGPSLEAIIDNESLPERTSNLVGLPVSRKLWDCARPQIYRVLAQPNSSRSTLLAIRVYAVESTAYVDQSCLGKRCCLAAYGDVERTVADSNVCCRSGYPLASHGSHGSWPASMILNGWFWPEPAGRVLNY